MRLLVLGGTRFVGRWVVTAAIKRGWTVTTLNRGLGSWSHPAAERLTADRLRPGDLAGAVGDRRWDMVVDTWAGAPRVVRESATALAGRAGSYRYVSSRAVYAEPVPAGVDETAATVDAGPGADAAAYGANKRGAEIAVEQAFADRAVLARAGLIIGPLEDRNQLPHWLRRAEIGGPMPVPGPPSQPFAYIDVRDLVAWLLDTGSAAPGPAASDPAVSGPAVSGPAVSGPAVSGPAVSGPAVSGPAVSGPAVSGPAVSGPVNLVVPPGHATMGHLITEVVAATGGHAEPVWIQPEVIAGSGVDRWSAFPGWIPPGPELAGLIRTDVTKALATGLDCRPLAETVADTWAWLAAHDGDTAPLDLAWERQLLDPAP